MKAFQILEPGKTGFCEIDQLVTKAGEVLLQTRIAGYCGSDLSSFLGKNPLVSYPRVPGHEVAATVVEVTDGVPENIPIGMNVTVSPYTNCGVCSACLQGRYNCCRDNQTMGVQRDGIMTDLFTVPWEKVILADNLSLPELALVEPLSVGFHAVDRGRVMHRDVVAVFGCGAIGLGAIAGAAFRNATVVAIDIDDGKLAFAKKCGATHVINSMHENLHERLQEITNGHGPEVMIEAIGLPQTFRAAVDEVCFAGRVVYIGYAKAPVEYETKFFVQKELDVLGSRNAFPRDFRDVIKLLQSGKFPSGEMITQSVPLDQAGELMAKWAASPGDFIKIHIEM